MKVKFALDLNNRLLYIEDIYCKHSRLEESNLLFIPNQRFPLENLHSVVNGNLIRSLPYMPYRCVPSVVSLLLWHIYDNTILNTVLFKKNPYATSIKNIYDDNLLNMYPSDILAEYEPNLTKEEIKTIEDTVELLYKTDIEQYILTYKDHIFNIDYEGRLFILEVVCNIKEYRFDELEDRLPMKEDKDGVLLWNRNC